MTTQNHGRNDSVSEPEDGSPKSETGVYPVYPHYHTECPQNACSNSVIKMCTKPSLIKLRNRYIMYQWVLVLDLLNTSCYVSI